MVAAIHDRMPVILQPEDYQTLAIAGSGSARADEAVPIRADDHVANRQKVGSSKNDTPVIIEETDPNPELTLI